MVVREGTRIFAPEYELRTEFILAQTRVTQE
jgi:hypothetical protein